MEREGRTGDRYLRHIYSACNARQFISFCFFCNSVRSFYLRLRRVLRRVRLEVVLRLGLVRRPPQPDADADADPDADPDAGPLLKTTRNL